MPKGRWIIVEIAALLALLCIPAVITANYANLPAKIPTHFGRSGAPDRVGDKSTLILLLIVGVSTYALVSAILFNADLLNVRGERTPSKIRAAIAMTRVVKLETTGFLAFLTWRMIQIAKGQAAGLGFIPLVFIGAVLATVAASLFITSRHAQ